MSEASLGNATYGYNTLMKQIEDYIEELEDKNTKSISIKKVIDKLQFFLDYGED